MKIINFGVVSVTLLLLRLISISSFNSTSYWVLLLSYCVANIMRSFSEKGKKLSFSALKYVL